MIFHETRFLSARFLQLEVSFILQHQQKRLNEWNSLMIPCDMKMLLYLCICLSDSHR